MAKRRRPQAQNPALRLNLGVQPTVTEAVTIPRLGRLGNVGSQLRDLASALKGFGNEMIGRGLETKALQDRENARKEQLNFLLGGILGSPQTNPVSGVSGAFLELVDPNEQIKGPNVELGRGTVDVDTLRANQAQLESDMERTNRGLNKEVAKGTLSPLDDPRIPQAVQGALPTASSIQDFHTLDLSLDTSSEIAQIDQELQDYRLTRANEIMAAPESMQLQLASQYFSQVKSLESKAEERKKQIRYEQNLVNLEGSLQVQLENIFESSQSPVEDIVASLDNLSNFGVSLGGVNNFYMKRVLEPVMSTLIKDGKGDQVISIMDQLGETRLSTGGQLGNVKEVQETFKRIFKEKLAFDSSEVDVIAAQSKGLSNAKFDVANKLAALSDKYGEGDVRVAHELQTYVDENYGNKAFFPLLDDYTFDTLSKSEKEKDAFDALAAENVVSSFIIDDNYTDAKDYIHDELSAGRISPKAALSLLTKVDSKDLANKLVRSDEYLETFNIIQDTAVKSLDEQLSQLGFTSEVIEYVRLTNDSLINDALQGFRKEQEKKLIREWKSTGEPPIPVSEFLRPEGAFELLETTADEEVNKRLKAILPELIKSARTRSQELEDLGLESINSIPEEEREGFFEGVLEWIRDKL